MRSFLVAARPHCYYSGFAAGVLSLRLCRKMKTQKRWRQSRFNISAIFSYPLKIDSTAGVVLLPTIAVLVVKTDLALVEIMVGTMAGTTEATMAISSCPWPSSVSSWRTPKIMIISMTSIMYCRLIRSTHLNVSPVSWLRWVIFPAKNQSLKFEGTSRDCRSDHFLPTPRRRCRCGESTRISSEFSSKFLTLYRFTWSPPISESLVQTFPRSTTLSSRDLEEATPVTLAQIRKPDKSYKTPDSHFWLVHGG